MQSIDYIPGSNGAGNASQMTVQNVRSPGASDILVNTVTGVPTKFYGSMGEPHTFTDPVTSEIITIISEATAVDFAGHVDAGKIVIDEIAPGYVDTRGSLVGDIVVVRPNTEWANNIFNVLSQSHNDDGTLKTTAVQEALNLPAVASPDWTVLATPPSAVVYNGQRSYTMTFPGVDYTDRLSPGARFKTIRTVAAPTRCTLLNGTNQYWNKTSPNKLTFTDDFVVDAYVKLTSYNGAAQVIASRHNGTSGWRFNIGGAGQVEMYGYNAASNNYSGVVSYQSIPLNKWVRVTAQLDMSSYPTVNPTTSYIMIDGVDVSASAQRGGTNPTALIQAGSLEIGSQNAGSSPFSGKIAQVAIYNAKVTQANIRATHSQGLAGSETSLACAYSFNGVATDLMTTTPNNLTAMNSAGYAADSPFGTQASGLIDPNLDYAIVSSAVFMGGNTVVTCQVPEGCTIPTSGGVSAVSYSGVGIPYGFPKDVGKWSIVSVLNTRITAANPSGVWIYPGSYGVYVPVGKFKPRYDVFLIVAASSGCSFMDNVAALSTSNTGPANIPGSKFRLEIDYGSASARSQSLQASKQLDSITQTVAGFMYLGICPSFNGTVSASGIDDINTITIENALL